MSKIVNDLEKIYEKIEASKTKKDITKFWEEFFTTYLKSIDFNDQAIKQLFEWGSEGHNWKELHLENSIQYSEYSKKDLFYAFKCEVQYIYDRISLDRLFRTHWLYNQWRKK